MPNRTKDSTLSGSSSRHDLPGMSGDVINPGITADEMRGSMNFDADQKPNRGKKSVEPPAVREVRGSGTDLNSDTDRLENPDNMQDKIEEDTFPASDPPSHSPMTGVGKRGSKDLPDDFKENKAAQFEYGRKSEASTLHFDRSTRRLEQGNPDIGEVDLGTIQADRPAEPDDNDHFDGEAPKRDDF